MTDTDVSNAPVLELGAAAPTRLLARGAWTAEHLPSLEVLRHSAMEKAARDPEILMDLSGVTSLDTFGAWLLVGIVRDRKDQGQRTKFVELKPEHRGLMDRLEQVRPAPPIQEQKRLQVETALAAVGKGTVDLGRDLVSFTNLLGAVGTALRATTRKLRDFRLTSTVYHLDRVGLQAVPIVLLINFLIGGIIAQQGFFHFRKFGADAYVVDMVGLLVLREIGVLIVSIMVAGRSGSSYTAELGAMKMREEVDALRTMGVDVVGILILPRILALIIALPALTFLGSIAALYGAGLIAWFYGGMAPDIFLERLREAVSITHFKVGMIKAPFMALIIGLVACTEGLNVKGSAESLGKQTTASVVKAIFLVIVLDGLFAIFFASIEM